MEKMEKKTYDREAVMAFLEKNLPGEGIIVDDIFIRWSRNEFTEEEIACAKSYLEANGMPENGYRG